jgi:hypothetical protein
MARKSAKTATTVRTAAAAPAERGGRYRDLAAVGGPEQENFPTALRLLPKPMRRDLLAISIAAADALAATGFDPLLNAPRPRHRRVLAHTLITVITGGRR